MLSFLIKFSTDKLYFDYKKMKSRDLLFFKYFLKMSKNKISPLFNNSEEMNSNKGTKWARVLYLKLDECESDTKKDKKVNFNLICAHLISIIKYFNKKNLNKFIEKVSFAKSLRRFLPWDHSLKDIESKYGGGFLSLFEFIRWLFLFNFIICTMVLVFIISPQYVYNHNKNESNSTSSCPPYDQFINITNDTKCCSFYYQQLLDNNTNSTDPLKLLTDVVKGTVSLFYLY